MNRSSDVLLDLDEVADILYVVRAGYDLNLLINEDSERVPGFVKRIDPISNECVGFMVHRFSVRFPEETGNMDRLKYMMDLSLRLTNEKTSVPKAA
jgi:hypothetical protein